MGLASSLEAVADIIDPRLAHWSVLLRSGKEWSERQLIPTFRAGRRGLRKLDWGDDLVSTGDIHRVKELRLHCPDGRTAILEINPDQPAFQFKTKSLDMLGAGGTGMEFQVIGRVTDKATGQAECFIWDYRPQTGKEHLFKYHTSIYFFGSWRDTLTPLGALGLDVQGFRL